MNELEPCGVEGCPALAIDAEGFCAVHKIAKTIPAHLADFPCRKCQKPIAAWSYIPRDATGETLEHASCPPNKPYAGRKVDRSKPLLEMLGGFNVRH